MNCAVVLFVYNRLDHTQKTVEALTKNAGADSVNLIVFSDGAKESTDQSKVSKVREYIKNTKAFKSITLHESPENRGLAASIISGVSKVLESYESVIVLEDDIVTSPSFLTYMQYSLETYKNKPRVFSISGYSYPKNLYKIPKHYVWDTYFITRSSPWGWATWKDRWEKVDWQAKEYPLLQNNPVLQRAFEQGGTDLFRMLKRQQAGKVNSWYIRFCLHHFVHGGLSLIPVDSLTNNIGHDGSGTHTGKNKKIENEVEDLVKDHWKNPEIIFIDSTIQQSLRKIENKFLLSRILNKLRSFLNNS